MSIATTEKLTPAQYLERERAAETKNEFLNGEVIPMVGASREHNLIGVNIASLLRQQLHERDCEVYGSDMRVRVDTEGLYTYPDVIVVCGEPQFEDAEVDTLLNPGVIVEVLSASTEAYDRGRKFEYYRTLDSLTDYILVSQDRHVIDHFTRTPENTWVLAEVREPDGTLEIPSIGCRVPLAEVYHKVGLSAK